jgi:hypothetical protein
VSMCERPRGTSLDNQCTLEKMKDKKVTQVLPGIGISVWMNGEGEGGRVWWICFVYV